MWYNFVLWGSYVKTIEKDEKMIEQRVNYEVEGKIGLLDADLLDNGTRHPNLVIMKLSGYFKEKDCEVELIENYDRITDNDYAGIKDYDAIYISKVFDFTKIDEKILEFENVYFGGTGFFFSGGMDLPYCIEHHMPDYHIYDLFIEHDTKHADKSVYWKDYTDYSIGFATRGCFRKCAFCVNQKYDRVQFHSHISEWLDKDRKGIYLWDDNIFGYGKWKEVFEELKATGKPFQFRQGLDIRLLTADKAKMLNEVKYNGDIIFAFDHIEDKPVIEEKLQLWRQYSDKSTKLYVLSGFDGQDEVEIASIFERISVIIKYGCLPYIMRHKNYETSEYRGLFIQIARWCNMPQFLKKMTFREFCEANQAYHKTEGTLCSSMRAMTEFEKKFPDIASKYFDLRFDDQEYVKNLKKRRDAEKVKKKKEKKRRKH